MNVQDWLNDWLVDTGGELPSWSDVLVVAQKKVESVDSKPACCFHGCKEKPNVWGSTGQWCSAHGLPSQREADATREVFNSKDLDFMYVKRISRGRAYIDKLYKKEYIKRRVDGESMKSIINGELL